MVSSVNLKLKVWVKVGDDGVVGGREGGREVQSSDTTTHERLINSRGPPLLSLTLQDNLRALSLAPQNDILYGSEKII